jgi:short-subunit dehydrogenase
MLRFHIVALTQLTKLFLPGMMKRQFGRILNLGSTGSFAPGPYNAVYCASKAYVLSISEALAEELRGTGVRVASLCPGATETAFAQRAGMTDTTLFQGRVLSAGEVAQAGYRALMRRRGSVVVGMANKPMIFSLRLIPRTLVARMSKRMLSRVTNRSAAAIHKSH